MPTYKATPTRYIKKNKNQAKIKNGVPKIIDPPIYNYINLICVSHSYHLLK